MKVTSLSGKVVEDNFTAEDKRRITGNKVWSNKVIYTVETKIVLKKKVKNMFPSVIFHSGVLPSGRGGSLCFSFSDSSEEVQFSLIASSLEIDCREK